MLTTEDDCHLLKLRETDKLIQGAKGYTREAADYLLVILKRVAAWERAVQLQNHFTKMDPDDVQFGFCEVLGHGEEHPYSDGPITLYICKNDGDWTEVSGRLNADNCSAQPLHLVLVHLSDDCGIRVLNNERVEPTDAPFTLTPMGESIVNFFLDEADGDEVTHILKLIASKEKVDEFLLGQDPLEIGEVFDPRGLRSTKGLSFGKSRRKLVHENEWFAKDLHVKLVRQLDRVTANDTTLANRKITIKGHPSLQAGISLSAAKSATRGVADKVADAKNVLVLIHGIIGDIEGVATGLKLARDADGKSVDQKFDLVSTQDGLPLETAIQAR